MKHSAKQWAKFEGGVLHSVNAIEGFWSLFKNSIRSTHIHVSPKHMDRYLASSLFGRTTASARTRCSTCWSGRFDHGAADYGEGLGVNRPDPMGFGLIDEIA